jgi:transcriptional regulator with XRE-family HTH domain
MADLAADLAFLIRAEMARRGMTQTDVAAAADINASTVTRLMHGKGMPDAPAFARICLWLKCDPAVFAVDAVAEAYRRGRNDQAAEIRAVLEGNDDA